MARTKSDNPREIRRIALTPEEWAFLASQKLPEDEGLGRVVSRLIACGKLLETRYANHHRKANG